MLPVADLKRSDLQILAVMALLRAIFDTNDTKRTAVAATPSGSDLSRETTSSTATRRPVRPTVSAPACSPSGTGWSSRSPRSPRD